MLNPQITRREFIKLIGAGTLAFALKDLRIAHALSDQPTQGRVTWSGIPLYDSPAFGATQIYNFRADEVVKISSIEENGEAGNPYNSVWYEIDGRGYTYSGWMQPVETNYQKPKFQIP